MVKLPTTKEEALAMMRAAAMFLNPSPDAQGVIASGQAEAPVAPDMRAICEALGFDPTNHHNAAKCPYCRPAEAPVAPQAEARQPLTEDLVLKLASQAFGYEGGMQMINETDLRILAQYLRLTLESAPTAPPAQAGTEENPNTYCVPTGKIP